MNRYKYLIIDGSNLYHRCYILGKSETIVNVTTVLKYCLNSINSLLEKFSFEESEIFFLFDNTQSQINIRKEIDSSYKSTREKRIEEDIYRYHNYLIELLKISDSRFRILMAGSLEADDLVKPLVKKLNPDNQNLAIMISNDLDWSRSLTNKVHWYNWIDVYDVDLFYSRWKFFPSEEGIKLYKAIKGDPSDHIYCSIHSLPIEILNLICEKAVEFKNFEDFIIFIQTLQDEKIKQKIQSYLKEIKRNYSLVDFIEINVPIESYIRYSKFEPLHYKLMLEGFKLPIPLSLKTKEELSEDFFR